MRGRTPLRTGLLQVPQGLGAALAMPAVGSLADRIGARPVVITGIGLALALTAAALVPALLLPGGPARPAPHPAGPARS